MSKIKVSFLNEEKEVTEPLLFQSDDGKKYFTKDKKNVIELNISSNGLGYRVDKYIFDHKYTQYAEKIINLFCIEYETHLKMQSDNFESGFDGGEDIENYEAQIKVPYDPNSIQVVQAKYSLKEVYDMINGYEADEEGLLDLSPDFQREYVWDNRRKSRLIESILLKIPLPVFYFSRDTEGKMQVVDGMQRLVTINSYFNNRFKLSDLEYLEKECGDCYFKANNKKSLNPKFVRLIRGYQIDCNIIEPGTPENVKLDIFKRLNTGGKELNSQEVRHAFMKKSVRDFIKKLAGSEAFLAATDKSISTKRMMDQELILRYIGFYCIYYDNFIDVEYSGKMTEFLDDIAVKLNLCKNIPYEEIYNSFCNAMIISHMLFGKYAFRKVKLHEEGEKEISRNPINKSLFIAFAICLSKCAKDQAADLGDITKKFAQYLGVNTELMKAISTNTNFLIKDITIGEIQRFLKGTGLLC